MKGFTVSLSLSADQLEQFFAGHVNEVWARDVNGVSLRFLLPHSDRLLVIQAFKGIFG
jgi:hypothetical protein